ncbi:hypothetical protein BHM03_00010369 [Ensete ventricosum]|nr:hypothetical protein BHM03_00010369 [Ensete ventricosum]
MNRKAYRGIRGFEGRIDFLSRYVDEKAGMPRPAAPEGERQRKEPPRVAAASRRRLPHRLKEQLLLGRRVMSVMVVVELEQHRLPVRRAPSTGGLVLPEPRPKKRRLIVPSEPHRPGGGETGHHLIEEVVVVGASVVLQLLKRNVSSDGGGGESARHPLHLLAARLHRQPQAPRRGGGVRCGPFDNQVTDVLGKAYVQSTRVPTSPYVRSTWSDHPSFMNVPAQLLVSWRLDQHCVSSIKYRAYQVGVRPTASVACQVGGALVS